MTLIELQGILGERIALAVNKDIPEDERKKEAELSQTIASLAKQMTMQSTTTARSAKRLPARST